MEQQLAAMQQQIAALQAQLADVANTSSPMQSADDSLPSPLHSLAPVLIMTGYLRMLLWTLWVWMHPFITQPRCLIRKESCHRGLTSHGSLGIQSACYNSSRWASHESRTKIRGCFLKHLEYTLSAAFRPLDILIHEIFTYGTGNTRLERYNTMLRDIHQLLIQVSSIITQNRNNIALQAINSSFEWISANSYSADCR